MITRAIVEQLIDRYTVKVRIPLLNGINTSSSYTPTADLSDTKICTLPGCDMNIQVDDVVVIGFENNDLSNPIIIGYLYRDAIINPGINQFFNNIKVNGSAELSSSIKIGNVTGQEIAYLEGLKNNIQSQLDALSEKIDDINAKLNA